MYHLKALENYEKKKKQKAYPSPPSLPRFTRWYTFVKRVDESELFLESYFNLLDYGKFQELDSK